MFTGLIETIGVVKRIQTAAPGKSYEVESRFEGERLNPGESIAVDGVCVTVEQSGPSGFRFTASRETLERSILNEKRVSDRAHLERALRLGDRLGGHLVQGHVDGIGTVVQVAPIGTGADLSVQIPEDLIRFCVEKGSLAVQGVSLTIARLEGDTARFALIPETLRRTYLGVLQPRNRVNLEIDILAKYVESLTRRQQRGISEEKLANWGFK